MKMKLFELVRKKLKESDNIGIDDAQEMQYTEEQILEGLDLVETPANIFHHQWELYKSHLRSSELKKLSELGKKARSEQVHAHTTGARSYARIRDEFMMKNKREPYALEFYDIVYKTKKGSYAKKASKKFMEVAKQEVEKRILELDSPERDDVYKRSKIEKEVEVHFMGPEKAGRARGHGKGVTKSQVTDLSYELRRMRGKNSTNDDQVTSSLLVQVESQSQQIESQTKLIESQNKQIQFQNQKIEYQDKQIMSLHQTVNEFRGELRLFQSVFQDSYAGTGTSPRVSREKDTS